MENQAFIDSLMREIIDPGVDRLMSSRYFTELREGALSKRRLRGLIHPPTISLSSCSSKSRRTPA